ncbi:MAG: RluA family pseudouridine synthase [Balneolales bacterium]
MSEETTNIDFTVPPGHNDNSRLDKYITGFVQNATRVKVQAAIKDGHVKVNQKHEKSSYKVQPGDIIKIVLPKPPPPEAKAEEIKLNIIHEDEHVIVVDKPAGMVVHPAFGNWSGTLVNGLMYHTANLSGSNGDPIRPGIVHRLDKLTSGLLVVAKNDKAHAFLSEQFVSRKISRTYHAIVWGTPEEEEGTLTGNIGRSNRDRKIMAVVNDDQGKPATTHYKVLEYFDHLSLVEIKLETGRTHQVRVHFSHHNHSVFGDTTYGGDSVRYGSNSGSRKKMFEHLFKRLDRQCLHAKKLEFIHPETKETVMFESELPGDFNNVLDKLRRLCQP